VITEASKSRLFALDYRLAPEHQSPAQLEDAVAAYTWLLDQGVPPENMVVAGDSAGAHLALGCLLKLRDLKMPMPLLAIALSPPTDFETEWPSFTRNAKFDWIQKCMLDKWAAYFCSPDDWANPLVSLAKADFTKLCPIYIQCGGAEILHDSIQAFGQSAQAQGAQVTIESWPDMNHVFQFFGSFSPQSSQALSQIGKVITETVRSKSPSLLVR
jgi:acetyl esterase/lipase